MAFKTPFVPRELSSSIGKWKILEMPGIDPGTSRMLSERSTIWATPPSLELVFEHDI